MAAEHGAYNSFTFNRPEKIRSVVTRMDDRRTVKALHERYRVAARRLFPGATLRELCSVNETADRDGAFLEMSVWISRKDADAPPQKTKRKTRAGRKK